MSQLFNDHLAGTIGYCEPFENVNVYRKTFCYSNSIYSKIYSDPACELELEPQKVFGSMRIIFNRCQKIASVPNGLNEDGTTKFKQLYASIDSEGQRAKYLGQAVALMAATLIIPSIW